MSLELCRTYLMKNRLEISLESPELDERDDERDDSDDKEVRVTDKSS